MKNCPLTNIKIFKEMQPKTEYILTESGRELINCFSHLDKWAIK